MTGKTATSIVILAALAILTGGVNPTMAGEDPPCVELRLKGGYEMTIPCPEGLDEILSLFQPRKRSGDNRNFAINPDLPDDRDMAKDPEWPHDEGMVKRPKTE